MPACVKRRDGNLHPGLDCADQARTVVAPRPWRKVSIEDSPIWFVVPILAARRFQYHRNLCSTMACKNS